MAKTLKEYQDWIDGLVQDRGNFASADRDKYLSQAVTTHDLNRPYWVTEVLTGDGNAYLELPEDWEVGFSQIDKIEYPLGNHPQTFLAIDEFYVAQVPTSVVANGRRLMFPKSNYPGTDIEAYIIYSQRHRLVQRTTSTVASSTATIVTVSGTPWVAEAYVGMVLGILVGTAAGQSRVITSNTTNTITVSPAFDTTPVALDTLEVTDVTIPNGEFEAVCNLGASIYCGALATYYAQTKSNTIKGVAADFGPKSQQEASREKALLKIYYALCPRRSASAIGAIGRPLQSGRGRLVHKARLR